MNLLSLLLLLIGTGSTFAAQLGNMDAVYDDLVDLANTTYGGFVDLADKTNDELINLEELYSRKQKRSNEYSVKDMTKDISLKGAVGGGVVLGSAAVFVAYKLSDTFRKKIDETFDATSEQLKALRKKIKKNNTTTIAAATGSGLLVCGLVAHQLGLFGKTEK